jgi:thiol-disulfide isomerase/thioredoxin
MTETVRTDYRVRASALEGRNWLNTGGRQLGLEDLRGKVVLLDFWTFCCINCLHVLDELRPLEEKYSDVLVTVGVHSPKFEHEADPVALAAAVERYEIHHPVLDDPELPTWQAYAARAWPTLVVLDPEGYIVANLSGEGHAAGLDSLISELVTEHEAKGTLHRGDGPYVPAEPTAGNLRFPGKAVPLPGGTFLVADTGHHRLVELEADLTTVRSVLGDGTKGWQDGTAATARFNEPQGLAVLPAGVAEKAGYDVVVADTVNHRLRAVALDSGTVTTVAGNGIQRLLDAGNQTKRAAGDPHPSESSTADPSSFEPALAESDLGTAPLDVSLSSPWDLTWSSALERLVVAMAGTHQIFTFDPVTGAVGILAGTGLEGLLDGPGDKAWFAQSSGLAEDAAGNIWVADSETSALRMLSFTTDDTGTHVSVSGTATPPRPACSTRWALPCCRMVPWPLPTPTTERSAGMTRPPRRCPLLPAASPSPPICWWTSPPGSRC